jgi:DNA-binding MarR family transcriptional regulator
MTIEEILKTSKLSDEKRTVVNLAYTASLITEKLSETLKPFQISLQQFNVLRILRGQHGSPTNLSTIQKRMVNKMSNTTRLVDKLIEKQLVKRNICKENRRKVEIFITQKGLDLLTVIDPLISKTEQQFVKNITTQELQTLNTLLDKLKE